MVNAQSDGVGALPDDGQGLGVHRAGVERLVAGDIGVMQRIDDVLSQLTAKAMGVVGSGVHDELNMRGSGGRASDEAAAAGSAFDPALLGEIGQDTVGGLIADAVLLGDLTRGREPVAGAVQSIGQTLLKVLQDALDAFRAERHHQNISELRLI